MPIALALIGWQDMTKTFTN